MREQEREKKGRRAILKGEDEGKTETWIKGRDLGREIMRKIKKIQRHKDAEEGEAERKIKRKEREGQEKEEKRKKTNEKDKT